MVSLSFAFCRLWDEFVSDLSKSIDCSADAAVEGKAGKVVIPGGNLLGKFQASQATDLHNANHFGDLGTTLLHAEPQKSYGIGTCNLMISAHTLKTPIRPEAEQEILFKLKCGFRQGLWPVLHLDDPVGHLEMPSRGAENASQKQLLEGLQTALSAVHSGRGLSLLQGRLSALDSIKTNSTYQRRKACASLPFCVINTCRSAVNKTLFVGELMAFADHATAAGLLHLFTSYMHPGLQMPLGSKNFIKK